MDAFEDFIIDTPYSLTEDDKMAINKASPDQKDGEHWKKDCLDDFKKRFRKYMLRKQHYRCAYCRLEIHDNEANAEIEHIVPKNLKPDWMYEPFNLCLSCKLCNTKKGHTKKILIDEEIKVLPKEKDAYLLVHPHLSRYSEHIELIDGIIYQGKTKEGLYTIWLCELDRYEVAAARAMKLIEHDHGMNRYTRILLMMQDENNKKLINNVDAFIERINDRIGEFINQAN